MYDTLIMLKPGSSFTVDDMHDLVVATVRSDSASVDRQTDLVRVTVGSGWLDLDWNDAAHIEEESAEMAELFGIPCVGCRARFEMSGEDPDMALFNDFLIINERLQATGKFVIFDPQEGKLMFDQ